MILIGKEELEMNNLSIKYEFTLGEIIALYSILHKE